MEKISIIIPVYNGERYIDSICKQLNNQTFKDFANSISKNSLGLLRHQKYSYQYILEDLRRKNPNLPSLYNIIMSYQITKANIEDGLSYDTRWAFNGTCRR